jgi:hypothetical protein
LFAVAPDKKFEATPAAPGLDLTSVAELMEPQHLVGGGAESFDLSSAPPPDVQIYISLSPKKLKIFR